VLHRAATRVPYYRQHWEARRRAGDRASWEYLENWPLLDKESLRQNPQAFVADDCDVRRLLSEQTSGSTGKPLRLWVSRDTARAWYALVEARSRLWYGVSRRDRWAILGGQLVTPASQTRPPFWVWNSALRQLYMSSYHLAAASMPHYLDALHKYQVRYIYSYTSSLYEMAREALRLNRRDIKLAVAITNAEPVFDYQRKVIEEAFQCSVRETYGMAEIAAAAGECASGRLHLWPEAGVMEVLDEYNLPASSGQLFSTGLLNADMPLIRYPVGDRVRLPRTDALCECGRRLPIVEEIEGRLDDVLFTRDGRRIGRLDPVFKTDLPVIEAQVIQEDIDLIRVRYVPASDYTEAAGRSIVERMRDRLGDVQVRLEEIDKLPRGRNGKFRGVICNLSKEKIETLCSPAAAAN
jgi:phenylacetate-CoA ligase